MVQAIKLAIILTIGFGTMLAPQELLPWENGPRLALVIVITLVIHAIFRALDPNTYRW